jgi:hypothetical protein
MREHINDTIAKKNAERKEIQDANRAKIKPKVVKYKRELLEMKERRLQDINLIYQITCAASQIRAWAMMDSRTEE